MTPEQVKELLAWYSTRRTIEIDIVGDFAGGELFTIHGESLIRHCLEKSDVDFADGFQLLHAVYAVEKFLSDLQKRGCNFDVIFFRDMAHVCAPGGTAEEDYHKYLLTRTILILHLKRSDIRSEIHEFDSFECADFKDYLSSHTLHFILCHEGEGDHGPGIAELRALIWKFFTSGKQLAIINFITWKTSKAFVHLLSVPRGGTPQFILQPNAVLPNLPPLKGIDEKSFEPNPSNTLTSKEWITVAFCRDHLRNFIKKDDRIGLVQVHGLLLHTAALRVCSLQERVCEGLPCTGEDKAFVQRFSEVSQAFLTKSSSERGRDFDMFDLIDGRIFSFMLERVRNKLPVQEVIVKSARDLWKEVLAADVPYSLEDFNVASQPRIQQSPQSHRTVRAPEILKFSHPAFNELLEAVQSTEAQECTDPTAAYVFEDLQHWHINKPLITWNHPYKPGFFARRRHQNLMASVVKYAESLQSLAGKTLEREIITVSSHIPQSLLKKGTKALTGGAGGGPKKLGKYVNKKGGLGNAIKAARAIQKQKARGKQDDIIRFWAQTCAEFQKDPSLVSQYLKAEKFLLTRSRNDGRVLGSEIRLYLCHILSKVWVETREGVDAMSPQGLFLISMMWHSIKEITNSETCTPEIVKAIGDMSTSLRMPQLRVTVGEPSRKLPFCFQPEAVRLPPSLVRDSRILQLQHGGPYMERRFDSAPDPRVPFEPDAWQRKVLDSIDANESLLVVAPTSAGKTFISFYAMKRVLEESDDAVLVYVAPTKALVNQIAAEIEARFSKSYQGKGGKSVWGIHTRDYRINNPSGCQILVTVPHILQIMLLAPVNVNRPNAWSHRVKRIIFDEVHCIGQAEDGVIWEQLLLLAPCPIIALSATVGNPDEFRDWLRVSQAQKGYKMTMIVHDVRYSDLRKFIYKPPPGGFVFSELSKALRLPVPGLDEGDIISPNFKFVHPVLALKDRNRASLDDVSLEARDCLSLWETMKGTADGYLHDKAADCDPKLALPEVISKSDVVKWEKNLKVVLRKAMEKSDSSLEALQDKLRAREENCTVIGNEDRGRGHISHIDNLFPLVCELHSQDALPGIVFNYDRQECENAVEEISRRLKAKEEEWKQTDATWLRKLAKFRTWQNGMTNMKPTKLPARTKDKAGDGSKASKLDLLQEASSAEISLWENFDPDAPLSQFSFADGTKMQEMEFDETVRDLRHKVPPKFIRALKRGLGVHHAGMNRRYRQVVEMMFRRGYIRVVVATGTLALGINMPCKTVVFSGDSVFLTAQNYRQASGRAGRRGFDLLGNVVFNGIPENRVHEIMSSRLPDLRGQFPISTTLILRLFNFLHGTDNSGFATNAVQALLSQTRLYLGGPDAEMSVKHHLRFSIEYLRRQNLLSDQGAPVNFAGMVTRLYFTENAVFAFHSLLRGGYFHRLCADIDTASGRILLEIMLVLSHLFKRVPVHRNRQALERDQKGPSVVFLPRLPKEAEEMLIQHNNETLSIFKAYVHSYINQYLASELDRTMPFTQTHVGSSEPFRGGLLGCSPTVIRSPFIALSGFGDDFKSIHELCSTVRGGVFLEESAIPYIPIWPHDTDSELNAYILDFYKHGSMVDLEKYNHIRRGDVWFALKDFSLILKTIITSLKGLVGKEEDPDTDFDHDDDESGHWDQTNAQNADATEETEGNHLPEGSSNSTKDTPKKKKKTQVLQSWDDESESSVSDKELSKDTKYPVSPSLHSNNGETGGLLNVLKAFIMLEESFERKFKKEWA